MLNLRFVTEHFDAVRAGLSRRSAEPPEALGRFVALVNQRLSLIAEVEALRADKNEANQAMAKLDKSGEAFQEKRASLKALASRIKEAEPALEEVERELEAILLELPNLPHASAPDGRSEEDNPVLRVVGEPPQFDFEPRDHVDLGESLGILDFSRAAKVSGARFAFLVGMGARLERALIQYMLDLHADAHGRTEVWSPALVNAAALRGTGQLPKFEADVFEVDRHYDEADDAERGRLFLSPTAEVQITNLHAGEIFEPGSLPRHYCGYSPCFRSEAGSYGKDTRGLIRQHQFDKVELVSFVTPEEGEAALEALTAQAEAVLKGLGLAYRVVELCTADLGFASQKTYDLEVWLPGQGRYREISSCSWFGEFQARRASIRYRPEVGAKPAFAHTLNGSGLAVGRTLVALLEQGQRADGSVELPEALAKYLGGRVRLEPV